MWTFACALCAKRATQKILHFIDPSLELIRMTRLLTASEVAAMLDVSTATVSRMLRTSSIPSEQCGARRVFHSSVVESWMKESNLAPAPADHPFKGVTTGLVALSFFTGAGGLDLGMEQAGISARLLCENMREARMSIGVNWPDKALVGDITELDAVTVRRMAGLDEDTEIDVMFGGPPCQAFSTAGARRAFDDPRGNCFLAYLDLASQLRPRYLIIENVRGLLSTAYPLKPDGAPAHGGAMRIILDKLEAMGYGVSFQLYDAANYGAFQHRERVVLIAKRDGTECRYLTPTNADDPKWALPAWRTFREAVAPIEAGPHHYTPLRADRLKWLHMVPEGGCWTSLPKNMQEQAMGKAYRLGGGKTGFHRRIAWDKPCPTLVTAPTMPATLLGHPSEDRVLSIEEYRAVQGFPQSWFIAGKTADVYRQIGNAVPVQLGTAIGRTILADMANEPEDDKFTDFPYSRYRNTSDVTWSVNAK